MPANGISFDTPSAPWMCIARYTTSCSTFGVATFTPAISVRALCPPTWSIVHAACSTRSRNWMQLDPRRRRSSSCTICFFASTSPWVVPAQRPLAHHVERPLARPDGAHGVVDAAAAEARLRDHERLPLAAEQVLGRHPHVVVADVRVRALALRSRPRGRRCERSRCPACRSAPGTSTRPGRRGRRGR